MSEYIIKLSHLQKSFGENPVLNDISFEMCIRDRYYSYGTAVSQILSSEVGASFTIEATGASKANIQLIASGESDMARVQNDVVYYAYTGTDLFEGEKIEGFSAMAGLYAEVCQIIADPSAGIDSIEDLVGKNVSVGDAGSGVEFNAKQILAAYGISFDDINVQNLSFGDSADRCV